MNETYLEMLRVGKRNGHIFVLSEKHEPDNFETIGDFIYSSCEEYKDKRNPFSSKSDIIESINKLEDSQERYNFVKAQFPNAKLYRIPYLYNIGNDRTGFSSKAEEVNLFNI